MNRTAGYCASRSNPTAMPGSKALRAACGVAACALMLAFTAGVEAGSTMSADPLDALERRVDAADRGALDEALDLSERTPPGASLERLAAMSGRFVRRDAEGFLLAQSTHAATCFGVTFLDGAFVDDARGRRRELRARRAAIAAVDRVDLASVRDRCLAVLDGAR